VTFKDLRKRISLETTSQQQYRLSDKLYSKPFWIWNTENHEQQDVTADGDCCFNHIIGLPTKEKLSQQKRN
jgi:hypothetical protein